MSQLLIDRIRISGFRGLSDFQMSLTKTTILTGVNNVGKTSILKAMQIALGNRYFVEYDDFHRDVSGNVEDKIIVDIRIVPVEEINDKLERLEVFPSQWEELLTSERIQYDGDLPYVPLRTIVTYDKINNRCKSEQFILKTWSPIRPSEDWKQIVGNKKSFSIDEIMFFYQEAQRDVVDDIKVKSSFLGKMLSKISDSCDPGELIALETLMKELNDKTVEQSDILSDIKDTLSSVGTAMDSTETIEITPFYKKLRDINKSIAITYGGENTSLPMDFHGMGTRSWTSLLTLKSFIAYNHKLSTKEKVPFFPIVAVEEPEAHLHPNAQKQIYNQLSSVFGQKIISTHSPYIAASSEITNVVVLSNNEGEVCSSIIDVERLAEDDMRKIRQKVINTRGEIFFSKALILFEGETEEQALPIFAEKYFGFKPYELGLDFVGVGGAGQYLPFIRFAESYNIPWYIFSDGEKSPVNDMKKAVERGTGKSISDIDKERNIFIIEHEEDFEKYMCKSYVSDIKEYYIKKLISECENEHKQKALKRTISRWTEDTIIEKSKRNKTQWALIFANSIVESSIGLPNLVTQMFDTIKNDLKL